VKEKYEKEIENESNVKITDFIAFINQLNVLIRDFCRSLVAVRPDSVPLDSRGGGILRGGGCFLDH